MAPTATTPVPTTTGGSTPVPTGTTGNPYTGKSVYVSPYYADEVTKAAASITDSALKAKYSAVAKVPTFIWLDVIAKYVFPASKAWSWMLTSRL